ncbi:MAG: SLC13 family permease [Vicinamibacterales bacterium]
MDPLGALLVAVVLSMVSKVNVGVVSLALARIVGVYLGGMRYNDVIGAFPVPLFITLAGVTLLFGMASVNGTLQRLAARAVSVCRGNAGIIPVMFFVVAACLSSIGPGNIATAALLAPMGMAVGAQAGVPAFLSALMIGNGAQAGALSPFAPTGVIVNGVMAKIGLGGHEWTTYGNNLMAHVVVTFAAYLLFGGLKLFAAHRAADGAAVAPHDPFEGRHWLTLAVLVSVVLGVVLFNLQVDGGLTGATLLALLKAGDEKEAIKRMPWASC